MKILVVSNLFPPHYLGGYELLCKNVCDELSRRGHDICVLTSDHTTGKTQRGSNPSDGLSMTHSYPVDRSMKLYIPFGAPPSISRWKRYRAGIHNKDAVNRIINMQNPDIVFVWSQLRLGLGAAYGATQKGLPVVYTFNDDHIKGFSTPQWGWSIRQAYRYIADCLIFPENTVAGLELSRSTAISRSTRDEIIGSNVDVSKTNIIYQGIPIEQFPLKETAGNVSSPVRIIYAGQLHHYKGVHTILEAAVILRKEQSFPFTITIAGSGSSDYEAFLKDFTLQHNLEDCVSFAGKIARESMSDFYQKGDIFVFPSIWKEPFGLTHLEAMASGTPVISTTRGGPGEFLLDGENALTFEAEDSHMLSEKVAHLVHSNELRKQIACTARETVEKQFSMSVYVDSLEALLSQYRL